MTKSEFDELFNSSYKKALKQCADKEKIEYLLNSKDLTSTADIVTAVFSLSLEVNKNIIHSVLGDVLQFDD